MDDSDVSRILRNMEKSFGKLQMIKSVGNPRLKHHLLDKYIYGLYSRKPVVANVKRGQTEYTRNIGQTRSHVSFKQYVELNKGIKDKYSEQYGELQRTERERLRQQKEKERNKNRAVK